MVRVFYTFFYYVITPFIFLRLKKRAKQAPAYADRWNERLGKFTPPEKKGGLWVHSVSVGETIAIAPLVKKLQTEYPEMPVTITTMTPTGSAQVKALFGDTVFHVYVPYDMPGAVKRFLNKVQPALCIIMETELWPNLIHYSRKRKIPIIIANARLSEKSAGGYAALPRLMANMLKKVAVVAAQSSRDGKRFVQLGLPDESLEVIGNVKFDIHVSRERRKQAAQIRHEWGKDRPVWIAASTHEGEDEQILDAFSQVRSDRPNLLLALVPRHPERFNQVAALCESRGFVVARRSLEESVNAEVDVMLGDTMGELQTLYGAADIAFVGGSLVESGGHNFLEPAAFGVPVVSGPYVYNFAEVCEVLLIAGAMKRATKEDLAETVLAMLEPLKHQEMSAAATQVVKENRGAEGKLFQIVKTFLDCIY